MSALNERWMSRLAIGGFLAAVVAVLLTGGPNAQGQQEAEAPKYEYNVASVDANALQAKLIELGNQGWELVVITTSEAKVDGAANPPKVVTEKYDVVLRKVVRK